MSEFKENMIFLEVYMGVQELCASHMHPVHTMENQNLLIATQLLLEDDILQNKAIEIDSASDTSS